MSILKRCISGIFMATDSLNNTFKKADLRLLIFIMLCLNFLSFTLSDNEESYLPIARQFMDPSWIPNSFIFTEWPGNRLVFEWITGWTLRYLSFEHTAFMGRILVFLAISFPLSSIFNKLQIPRLSALILLQIYLIRQSYFAGEFIFADFEPKSIAYIFVLAGVSSLLSRKYLFAVFWGVIAAYLHFLVGGWFFLLLILYTLFNTKSIPTVSKQVLIFSLLMAPFVYYLGKVIFKDGSVVNGVNIDWVYVYFRNPHHTAPFSLLNHLPGTILKVTATGILFILTLFYFRRKKGPVLDELYLFNIIIFLVLFISLGISLLDHNGFFLKFYPFRLAALGELLMYIYLYKYVTTAWNNSGMLKPVFLLLALYVIIVASVNTIGSILYPPLNPSFEALVSYVKQNTRPDDIVLSLGDYDLSFSRRTRREVFVNYKFDPGGGKKIYEWYWRILARKKLAADIGQIDTLLDNYRINYILSNHPLTCHDRLKNCYENNGYFLYKIL